jgi:adenosylcobinamide amidohydrolase
MHDPFSIALAPPHLVVAFNGPHQVLSWAPLNPGLQVARRVAWLEVRNADLPPEVDALEVIRQRIAAAGLDDAVTLVTSRDISRYQVARATIEDQHVRCIATVGLSNSERVGTRLHQPPPFAGTINLLVHVGQSLTEGAMLEAMSIATEARTAAVIDSGVARGALPSPGPAPIASRSPLPWAMTRYNTRASTPRSAKRPAPPSIVPSPTASRIG